MTTFYHATQLPLFPTRICATCAAEDLLINFPIHDSKRGKYRIHCKTCWNALERGQRALTREEHNHYQREQRARRPEHQRFLYQRQYLNSRVVRKERSRRWEQKNPLRRAELGMRRRARKLNVAYEEISYSKILQSYGYNCHICGGMIDPHDLEFDHVIPLARGGKHSEENIKPSHRVCNRRKKDRLLEEMTPFQRRGI